MRAERSVDLKKGDAVTLVKKSLWTSCEVCRAPLLIVKRSIKPWYISWHFERRTRVKEILKDRISLRPSVK